MGSGTKNVYGSPNFATIVMKPISPLRVFVLLALTIAVLVGLVFAFPSGQIPVTEDFSLRWFSKEALLNPGGPEAVDISDIVETELEDEPVDTLFVEPIDTIANDTIIPLPAEEVIARQSIEFPAGIDSVLDPFFEGLMTVQKDRILIRILHYGDSQVEGDRITSELRQKFHTNPQYGGCGPGIIPITDILQGRASVKLNQEGPWLKYSVFEDNPSDPPHREYSVLGNFYRYKPFPELDTARTKPDTLITKVGSDTTQQESDTVWASFTIAKSNLGYASVRKAQTFKLLYTNNEEPLHYTLVLNESDTLEKTLPKALRFVIDEEPLDDFKSVQVIFESDSTPDLYGGALDCNQGVAVDNIGMRGSSVTNFGAMDPGNLARQLQFLNVKLIIMQFGVNVVPYETDSYKYYERMYYNQLMALKRAAPNMPVLVVGVSDMAKKSGTGYESYPNIKPIRQAQKNAAMRAGCAFWDLYEAMGGKNSMISWVHNDPPLAEDDYTHFSAYGARIVGKMLYDALMEAYYGYAKEEHPQ